MKLRFALMHYLIECPPSNYKIFLYNNKFYYGPKHAKINMRKPNCLLKHIYSQTSTLIYCHTKRKGCIFQRD